MNMISTGAFQTEMDVSSKQQELIKKLTAVWEKKNSKAARAGGVSLMALSLAACGDDDDTPFSQADVDAAVAASEADFIAEINDAIGSDFTGEEDSAVVLATIAASDNGPLEVQVAQALVAQQTAEATAAAALVAQAQAEAQAAAALVAQATAEAQVATAQAATTAAEAAQATAEASLATVQAQYDALIAPKSAALTNSATADSLVGGVGDDTFTGAAGTLAAADTIRDNSSTDNDTLTITDEDGTIGAFTAQNIENINLNINSLADPVNIDAANYTGVTNLTVTRGDLSVGGSTLTGSKTVDVVNVNGEQVSTITTAGSTTDVTVVQQDGSGVTLNVDNASGGVTVTGAATVNAAGAGAGDTVQLTAMTLAESGGTAATEVAANSKAVNVNTGAATVTLATGGGNDFDGAITINATAAGVVTIPSALGGATVTALGSTANGVDIRAIDASGATVTTTLNQAASAAAQVIDLGAVATANVTATASVSALGNVALNTGVAADGIDTLTLSGNGGAVNYTITTGNGNTETFNVTSDVTLTGDEAVFDGEAITGNAAAIMLVNTSTGGATIDAADWTASKIGVAFNQTAGAAITAASGQNYEFTTNQTGIDFDFSAGVSAQSLTLTAGDVNGAADTTVGTVTMGAMDVTSGTATSGTVAIVANESNLTATSLTAAALQDITISGDEDVNLGTVATANSINGSASTGVITATAGAAAKTLSGGAGADQLTLNGNRIHTLDGGGGNDTITVTSTAATSTVDGGAGNDGITITDVDQIVVIGGLGTDNFNVGVASAATIVGGDGSDTLTVTAGGVDLAAGFAIAGVEKINITATNGTTDFTAAEFAGLASSEITGNSATDVLQITAAATGSTLDMSGLTASAGSSQTINTVMGAGNDTITGSVLAENFVFNGANGWKGTDNISGGGTGTDTISSNDTTIQEVAGTGATSSGLVVNLGTTAISNVNVLANASGHLGGTTTQVAAGSIAYMYAAADTTNVNSTVTDSVSGIENFISTDAAGVEYVVGNSSANVIQVGAGNDYVEGGAGGDTINGGDGVDTLIGGDGDDIFTITALSDLTDGTNAVEDTITGGNGTGDTLAFSGGVTLAAADDFTNKVTGVESLSANGAQAGVISITTHSTFVTDTGITTIDLSGDTDATGDNVINIANQGTTTAMTLTGGAGKETFTLDAGSVDTVVISNGTTTTVGTTADTIAGFVTTADKIDFNIAAGSGANYAEASADHGANNTLGVAAGLTAANTAMNTTVIYFLADNTNGGADNGYLYFDANADGTADGCVILTGLAALTDFGDGDIIA